MSDKTPTLWSRWRRLQSDAKHCDETRADVQRLKALFERNSINSANIDHSLLHLEELTAKESKRISAERQRLTVTCFVFALAVAEIWRRQSKQLQSPPLSACYLLDLLLTKLDRDAIPGDMEEEFSSKLAKYGLTGARLWFWLETVRVIASRNAVCRWILIAGLMRIGKWIMRMVGS